MAILETRKSCKYFRPGSPAEVRAIDGVSLAIPRSSFCMLTGPSGSGKTTLLALLGALERPTRGQVYFDGQDLSELSDVALTRVRRRLGFLFQSFALIPRLPVWENVSYPLIPRGTSRAKRYEIARTLLARLGVERRLLADPETLSGGEKQRVALARALAGRPEVLLADEPTANLDPESSRSLASLLCELHAEGTTVVVASLEAGLSFEMRFLTNEQGQNFKINLYDHGCGVVVGDYDGDAHDDIYFLNQLGPNALYKNKGNGTFVDVTQTAGVALEDRICVAATFGDYDNDGDQDLFVTSTRGGTKYDYVTGPSLTYATNAALDQERRFADIFHIEYDKVIFGNTFYENLGDGRFEEVSDKTKLETFWPWGIATGDFDNDGNEDVYLPSGMGYPFFYWRSPLMMNNGDETFSDRSGPAGIAPPVRGKHLPDQIGGKLAPRSSRCGATADFDGDGRLDIVVNNFNDYPYYFKNEFPQRNYISFRLKGTQSNSDAIGASVKVFVGKTVMTRQVHPAGGYLSQSSKTVHFGVGDHAQVDRVEIRWPSGVLQSIESPSINKVHDITEPEA